jgi:hypothetical protein
MGLDVQIRGVGLDEDFVGQRRYSFVLRSVHRLDAQPRIEFQDLVRTWYLIGFHCLTDSDLDLIVASVVVTVSEHN